MYIDPLLPLIPLGQKHPSWPKFPRPRRVEYHPLSKLLTMPGSRCGSNRHARKLSVPVG